MVWVCVKRSYYSLAIYGKAARLLRGLCQENEDLDEDLAKTFVFGVKDPYVKTTISQPQEQICHSATAPFQEKGRMSNIFIYSSPLPRKIQRGKPEILYAVREVVSQQRSHPGRLFAACLSQPSDTSVLPARLLVKYGDLPYQIVRCLPQLTA